MLVHRQYLCLVVFGDHEAAQILDNLGRVHIKANATLATNDCADWLTMSEDGTLGALDVRLTLKTDDDAFIYVEYGGRVNMAAGVNAAAPTFQTGHEKYKWMNGIQAVLAGQVNLDTGQLIYRLYEVKVTAEKGLV